MHHLKQIIIFKVFKNIESNLIYLRVYKMTTMDIYI